MSGHGIGQNSSHWFISAFGITAMVTCSDVASFSLHPPSTFLSATPLDAAHHLVANDCRLSGSATCLVWL